MLPGRQPFKVGVYVTCGTLGPGSSEQAVATERCLPYVSSLVRATILTFDLVASRWWLLVAVEP